MKEKNKKLHSIILWEPVNRKIYLCLSRRQLKEQMEASYRKEHMRYVHQLQNPDGSTLRHVLVKWLSLGDKTKTKNLWTSGGKEYHLPKKKKKKKTGWNLTFRQQHHTQQSNREAIFQGIPDSKMRIKEFVCCQCVLLVQG